MPSAKNRQKADKCSLFLNKTKKYSNADQLIIPGAEADLFSMGQGFPPADIGIAVFEMIMMMVPSGPGQIIRKLAVGQRLRGKAEIRTGLVQSYRIE